MEESAGSVDNSRDSFTGMKGFILSSVGSAVGMGNIWRFPIMVSLWGGLTFLIPYFIFVVLIASTGVIGEFALGRATRSGPSGAFGTCTELRWKKRKMGENIGLIPVVGSLGLAIGYTCVMAWLIKYAFLALDGELYGMGQDMGAIVGMFESTASAWGANLWVIIAVVITFLIMSMGISKGVEKVNKVLIPVLYLLMIGMAVYVSTLPGSSAGYSYILTVNTSLLMDPLLWIFAFGQAFFSLSVAGNGSVIYGSYLGKNAPIPKCAGYVALFDTLAALLAALVIIPAMAAGGAPLDSGGPGLMFIYLVNVFNGMVGGRILGIVFFIAVVFAGLTSLMNLYETPVSFIQERFGAKRSIATAVMLLCGCIVALTIQAIVSDWMDVMSIVLCPLGALLAGVMFYWISGKDFARRNIDEGSERPMGAWQLPLGRYAYCSMALLALIAGIILGGIG